MSNTSPLGDVLVSQGLMSSEQLSRALSEQKDTKEPLGDIFLKNGYIRRETDIVVAVSQIHKIQILIGEQLTPSHDQKLKYVIPEATARKHLILPISRSDNKLTVAFSYNYDIETLNELKKTTGIEIDPVLAHKQDLEARIDLFYKTEFKEGDKASAVPAVDVKASMRKLKLGEILVRQGLITDDQLQQALVEQKKTGHPLGEILVNMRFVRRETDIMVALSQQLNLPVMVGDQLNPRADQRLKDIFPEKIAKERFALPLFRSGKNLTVAFAKPFDLLLLDDLKKITSLEIIPVLATPNDLRTKLQNFYGDIQLEEVVSGKQMEAETKSAARGVTEGRVMLAERMAEADQPPVIRFVDLLLKKSIEDRASDIHIEPFEDRLIVRYRVDGILYELPPPPKQMHLAVVSRVKILSKLDIAEKRVPQDGSFSITYKSRNIDVRVSTVPVVFGERVVMRLLDKGGSLKGLSDLGFDEKQLKAFQDAVEKPYGLIYVTGPTGSGKTTTLYAAINYVKSTETNILTIEDPVEFQMPGIGQVQVKPDIGLTFASGLRAFLRQDPDIILVGEVRDEETADVCVRAALTGHLVLSTLHTNDAPTAVTRLVDIGIKPYLVASSLILIGAQRLVRKLCPNCKEPYEASDKEMKDFRLNVRKIYKAKGCKECRDIGYWGRVAIYEIMPITEQMRSVIARGEEISKLREAEKEAGIATLFDSGVRKVEQGITTLEEVLSVAYE